MFPEENTRPRQIPQQNRLQSVPNRQMKICETRTLNSLSFTESESVTCFMVCRQFNSHRHFIATVAWSRWITGFPERVFHLGISLLNSMLYIAMHIDYMMTHLRDSPFCSTLWSSLPARKKLRLTTDRGGLKGALSQRWKGHKLIWLTDLITKKY